MERYVGGGWHRGMEVWKSSCVQGDRAQAQSSLETCLVVKRGLEQHVSIDANWQVGDFCFLRGSSQGAGGEEAGGKATQVWGWTGREGWEDPGMRGQGGHPSGQRRGWNRCGQLEPGYPTPSPGRAASGPLCKGKTKGLGASWSWNTRVRADFERALLLVFCLYGQMAPEPSWTGGKQGPSRVTLT